MLKAVLFDFDGTIVDSLRHHLKAWKRSFLETGSDLSDEEVIRRVFYQPNGEDNPKYKVDGERFKLYEKYIDEAYENLEQHKDIDIVLEEFKKRSIKMAIISFAESYRIAAQLKKLKLEHYFEFILGGDTVENPKPNPEIALIAMNKLSVSPHETLLVGDTNWDILTGKNAGTMTALFIPHANMSFINLDVYRSTNPDFEFNNFQELFDRLIDFI
jgi:HAD superfamily hydrolase (TIGR01549 family)